MKKPLKLTVGFLVLCALAALAGPARADSPGPYYATPSWDQTLPSTTRFIVLSNFSSAAVLDRETGLVWEKSPDTNTFQWSTSAATIACANKSVGGRKGWRLPSINELASLIDPSVPIPGPTLPAGHPFTNVQSDAVYWSATTNASFDSSAWIVGFGDGNVNTGAKTVANPVWCVRGGGVLDNY